MSLRSTYEYFIIIMKSYSTLKCERKSEIIINFEMAEYGRLFALLKAAPSTAATITTTIINNSSLSVHKWLSITHV